MSRNLMIQGTMSGVGKSIITAGLLRVFFHDGYKCAPFKSQNMALNSYVTEEGCEIGRAQAQQAFAAGVKPAVDMNPVLLKPDGNNSSQIILCGRPVGNMNWKEYTDYKKKIFPDILKSYNRLSKENDIIVIEGAGSPVELNLKEDDIVNMGFAESVDSPVLLVADINPGGVFAQIYGTYMLLEDGEKKRVKGIIINKFRGDMKAFESGIKQIECLTGVPVLGVVPYLDLKLDEEDSESSRFETSHGSGPLKIAVIRLPFISNYTDMLPLEEDERVTLFYTDDPKRLKDAHLIIVPGAKNTYAAAKWMHESGMMRVIKKRADEGTVVFGICGGYQLLGLSIKCESGEEICGAGILPVRTVFREEKVLTKRSGRLIGTWASKAFGTSESINVYGYEIHMGETVCDEDAVVSGDFGEMDYFYEDETGKDGCVIRRDDKLFIGTYLHGIFDSDEFRQVFIQSLCLGNGLECSKEGTNMEDFRLQQFDLLEQTLRDNLDIGQIYRIMDIYN